MKLSGLLLLMLLGCGCASHQQLACRFVAVDGRGNVLKAPTAQMHSHWHKGAGNCESMIGALASGLVTETITGNKAGVEVRGPKEKRLLLKRLFEPLPAERQGVAQVGRFPVLMELAE